VIAAYIWEGDVRDSRVVVALCFTLINLFFFACQGIALRGYLKDRTLSRTRQSIYLFLGKYLRPFFQVIAIAGLPKALVKTFDGDALGAITAVLIVIETALHVFDTHGMSARLLLEGNPIHEWYWHLPVLQMVLTQVLGICSGAAACTTGTALAVFPAVQFVVLVAFGVYCLRASPTIRRSASILIAAASFSAAIASLIGVICAISEFSGGPLLLIFEVLLFIAGG
jgi:hypothetical protein